VTVDERTLQVRGRVAVPGEPDGITVANGRILVASTEGPTVTELAPGPNGPQVKSARVLGSARRLYDQANVDIEVLAGRIFVSSVKEDAVYVLAL
jgi:hypothetical protein